MENGEWRMNDKLHISLSNKYISLSIILNFQFSINFVEALRSQFFFVSLQDNLLS